MQKGESRGAAFQIGGLFIVQDGFGVAPGER